MPQPSAIVLLSGGMDSCVTTSIAARDYSLALLHSSYGQRTERRELQAFHDIANHYHVPSEHRLVFDQRHLAAIGGSALTDDNIPVPEGNLAAVDIPTTYVPFRNANLLSAATSWAEALGASAIFAGAVEEDSSGYPDCRRVFFDAFQSVIETGTRPETAIRIITPVIGLSKAQIVRLGVDLNAPLNLTWSCYQNEDLPCGRCDSCLLRSRAFREAGIEDPLS